MEAMMVDDTTIIGIVFFLLAPFIGMLVIGLDRKITARMQNRIGPPVLQPLYDVMKLFGKEDRVVNKAQIIFAIGFFGMTLLATVFFCLRSDLLVVFFLLNAGAIFMVLGAYSTRSAFSTIGANRELIQMLAYEPIFLLVIFCIGYTVKSFEITAIYEPLILKLPLALVAMVIVLMIKMQKSPFDISTAHTEIISGTMVEYSGTYLGILKLTHWYELFVILGVMGLFVIVPGNFLLSIVAMILLIAIVYLVVMIIDNITTRLTWDSLPKVALPIGIGLIVVNMIFVAVTAGGA
ncbi:MAG: NADH-quinone oxidoreductase subunit H [Thermoplasmata archaeon]|nr:NADH-quinone oxidoreductase subunit H [Thermoplasmata archaeon]